MPTHYHVLMILSILLLSTDFSVPLIYAVHTTKLKSMIQSNSIQCFRLEIHCTSSEQVPFGVTNGVACFQRAMDSIITEE